MARSHRIVLGLNSGTSADGVDAVACDIAGRGLDMRVRVLGHVQIPYPSDLRDRILRVMAPAGTRTEEICRLETEIGQAFADAAGLAVKRLGLKRVDLVGSHGQTVCHLPLGGGLSRRTPSGGLRQHQPVGSTLQLGDPAAIAARLRAPVVARFRQSDLAVGGQGAPLVPWTDYVLFRDVACSRIIQNIGGIANLTWLPASCGPDEVTAFDTGPGNMIIDALVRRLTAGREAFDKDGRRAARGSAHPQALRHLMSHPFFSRKPPKSCGREEFGEAYVTGVLSSFARAGLRVDDWIATATVFTAASMARAYASLPPFVRRGRMPRTTPRARPARRADAASQRISGQGMIDEIVLCGGGAANGILVAALAEQLRFELGDGVVPRLTTTAEYGIPAQAKEGVSFAMLAAACTDGVAANLRQVTGARCQVVLGQICNMEPLS